MSKQTFAAENNKQYKEFKDDLENFSNLCKTHAESFGEIIEMLDKSTENHPFFPIVIMVGKDIIEYTKKVANFRRCGKLMEILSNNPILEKWTEMTNEEKQNWFFENDKNLK